MLDPLRREPLETSRDVARNEVEHSDAVELTTATPRSAYPTDERLATIAPRLRYTHTNGMNGMLEPQIVLTARRYMPVQALGSMAALLHKSTLFQHCWRSFCSRIITTI